MITHTKGTYRRPTEYIFPTRRPLGLKQNSDTVTVFVRVMEAYAETHTTRFSVIMYGTHYENLPMQYTAIFK